MSQVKGAPAVLHAWVGSEPIDTEELRRVIAHPAAGASVVFTGDVRDNDHGRAVVALTYEAHPSAQQVLDEIAREVSETHDVFAMAVAHRHGPIPIGESALVAAVSARHRQQAFDACIALVELTKQRIPIWKHQTFDDGTDEWVNCA
ncbi:MAG: molybdenum cofactor biosynthesis protein MoaE [Candidatus Nanopelagicales bacterium]